MKCTLCSNTGYNKIGYFAIITMENIQTAMDAIAKLNGIFFSGQRITVKQVFNIIINFVVIYLIIIINQIIYNIDIIYLI